jgi:hypothetical protein
VRVASLAVSLPVIAAYAHLALRGTQRAVVLAGTPLVAVVYGALSWRCRRFAREATIAEVRSRFLTDARRALAGANLLLVRSLVWAGIGVWAWAAFLGWAAEPLGGGRGLTVFLGCMGLLLGARSAADRFVDIPRLRRDLAALEPEAPEGTGSP